MYGVVPTNHTSLMEQLYLALRIVDIAISGLALLTSVICLGLVLGMKWSRQSILYQPVTDPIREYEREQHHTPEPEEVDSRRISDETEQMLKALGLGDVDEESADILN